MSISGVVLRLEPLGPSSGPRLHHHPNDNREATLHFQGDGHMPYNKASSLPDFAKSGGDPSFPGHLPAPAVSAGFSGSVHPHGNMSDPYPDNRNNYPPTELRNPMFGNRIMPSSQGSYSSGNNANDPGVYHERSSSHLVMPGTTGPPENNSLAQYGGGTSNHPSSSGNMSIQEPTPSPAPASLGLQPHQLAQLVSSLLAQQGQCQGQNQLVSSNPNANTSSTVEDFRPVQQQSFQNNNQQNYDSSATHYGQLQELQQQTANVLTNMNREVQPGAPSAVQGAGPQDGGGGGGGGVKRLEATLELAATLLKQIQQGKGP